MMNLSHILQASRLAIFVILATLILKADRSFARQSTQNIAARNADSTERIPVPNRCAPGHRVNETRNAVISIEKITQEGFYYSDLEDHAVSARPLHFADSFEMVRMLGSGDDIRFERLPQESLKKGMRGYVTYCSMCRAVFMLCITD